MGDSDSDEFLDARDDFVEDKSGSSLASPTPRKGGARGSPFAVSARTTPFELESGSSPAAAARSKPLSADPQRAGSVKPLPATPHVPPPPVDPAIASIFPPELQGGTLDLHAKRTEPQSSPGGVDREALTSDDTSCGDGVVGSATGRYPQPLDMLRLPSREAPLPGEGGEVSSGFSSAATSDLSIPCVTDHPGPFRVIDVGSEPSMATGPEAKFDGEDLRLLIRDLDTGRMVELDTAYTGLTSPSSLHHDGKQGVSPKSIVGRLAVPKPLPKEKAKKKKKRRMFWRKGKASASSESENDDKGYVKTTTNKKAGRHWDHMTHVQDLPEHSGAVWCMSFSLDGRYLATGGQDMIVRVWEVIPPGTDASAELAGEAAREGPARSRSSSVGDDGSVQPLFRRMPKRRFEDHTSDILDLAWSKSNFLLSSSRDKTVRLYHVEREKLLAVFQHVDLVTSVCFHPIEEAVFVTTSFDRKIRLWNLTKHRVVSMGEATDFVTACAFTPDGKRVICGMLDGTCLVFEMSEDKLVFSTSFQVRSTRGKNRKGSKITGIVPSPDGTKVLITSNDSRIRLYNINDYSLECKYKGLVNVESQIKATFSDGGRFIIVGSEDKSVYIFDTVSAASAPSGLFSGPRKDRSELYESYHEHADTVTVAIFAPCYFAKSEETAEDQFVVSAGYDGVIKVFHNKAKDGPGPSRRD